MSILKSRQVELWTECNNLCSFCYLGQHNRHTPDNIKIKVLEETLKLISDLTLYEKYDTLAFIGGEFFQGQLANTLVRAKFFELMSFVAHLMRTKVLKTFWLSATLTIGSQVDLYESLNLFNDIHFDVNNSEGLWIITSFDTIGRFHTASQLENWKFHMKNIKRIYPNIKFNTCTILTGDIVNKFLNDSFNFSDFMKEYNTNFFFKQPAPGSLGDNLTPLEAKRFVQSKIPDFFPTRSAFLKFLEKFARENFSLYDKLYNIKYRADDLYRNYNHAELMIHNKRFKNSIKETDVEKEATQLSCGHLANYAAYIDSDKCMICDKNAFFI